MISPNCSGAILTINLKAIIKNWKTLSKKLDKKTLCAAAIKTNAYGLGARKVASALVSAGCKNYFVAYPFEGKELREVVGNQQIFVLNGIVKNMENFYVQNDLIPVINSLEQLKIYSHYAKKSNKKLKIAVHFDTGMVRLGIPTYELLELLENNDVFSSLEPVLVMSHLSCADDKKHPKNAQQLELFKKIKEAFKKKFPNIKASLANSAGIYLGKEYHFDMVRPGIALYGGRPFDECSDLENVVGLKAQILQIQKAKPPQTIGYGATYELKEEKTIATASIGYGDGFFRSLSNKGCGYINGQKAPIVGRVSMDLTSFDVSNISQKLSAGDYIDIISLNNPIEKLAKNAKTVNYEVLTNLGRRYYKNYIGETY